MLLELQVILLNEELGLEYAVLSQFLNLITLLAPR